MSLRIHGYMICGYTLSGHNLNVCVASMLREYKGGLRKASLRNSILLE